MRAGVISYCAVALLTVLAFQNCTKSNFGGKGDSSSQQAAHSGGQPYDGKPYVHAGQSCPDGTVESRIIYHNANSATLVKDGCQLLNPAVDLNSSQFSYDSSSDTVNYSSRAFVAEASPAAKLQPGASFYMQISGAVNNNTAA